MLQGGKKSAPPPGLQLRRLHFLRMVVRVARLTPKHTVFMRWSKARGNRATGDLLCTSTCTQITQSPVERGSVPGQCSSAAFLWVSDLIKQFGSAIKERQQAEAEQTSCILPALGLTGL
ncbi:unnamed protein product [Pleuronectes platessa]|uniref:Uncharacterized protein n=1 Tax=Pleuronectes platessa TaxID=8262 RepID=A0A9N7U0Z2_PLEPL|nr:unnamed protein product [Pleuronectes platessa]